MIHSQLSDDAYFTQPLGYVYAQGKLATFLRTDIVSTSSLETFVKYEQVRMGRLNYSIHDTVAINKKGEIADIRCYFWLVRDSGVPRGLIVLKDDYDDELYAIKKCMTEAEHI